VVQHEGELLLVMEYVEGESLMGLLRASHRLGERLPIDIAVRVVSDVLAGLHAAHEAKSDAGAPLSIVHRDVSPSNVMVGTDGVARVLDFGVAKAAVRVSSTRQGGMKGKLRYMSPEQISDQEVTRRTDVYAASVMLWELLIGEALFTGSNEAAVMARILQGTVSAPTRRDPSLPAALDEVVLRGLARDPDARFPTAREMALALERALPPASAHRTGEWVSRIAADALSERRANLARVESGAQGAPVVPPVSAPSEVTKTAAHALPSPTEVMDGPTQLVSARQQPLHDARVRAPWMLVSLAAVTVAAVAIFLLVRAVKDVETPAAAAPVPTGDAAPAENPDDEVDSAPSSERAAATADVAPSAPAPTPTARRPFPAPRARPSAPNCDPPYTVDAQGRRRAKRECL
jgi:serine/threonine-protein kinase